MNGQASPLQKAPDSGLRTPDWGNRLLAWIGDRSNPMLVRCIRQELRSKTFLGVFVLLLVISAISAIATAGASSGQPNSQMGRTLFSVLAWAWSLVVVIQAMTTFQAVIRERNEDTWDLLDLTGMGPRPVLRGLLLANLVQGQLYTAALAPFLVMAYLLRGIDLLTIGFALIFLPLMGIAASTLAVFLASIGNSKPARAFFGGILGLSLVGVWITSAGMWFNLEWLDYGLANLIGNPKEGWTVFGLLTNIWLAFVVMMLVLSGAMMTHRAGDRSSGPRLLWMGMWINALGWFIGMGALISSMGYASGKEVGYALGAFAITGVLWAGLLGLFSVSEDIELSPRQARTITNAPRWRKWVTVFHGPGANRGRLIFIAMMMASLGVGLVGKMINDHDEFTGRCFVAAWILCCYLAALFVVGDYLYRGPARSWLDTTALRRGFLLVLFAAFSLGPILAALVVDANGWDRTGSIAMISPIMGVSEALSGNTTDRDFSLVVVSLIGIAALARLMVQGLRLRITTQRIAAREDDRNPRAG
jgi:hypothetical protein